MIRFNKEKLRSIRHELKLDIYEAAFLVREKAKMKISPSGMSAYERVSVPSLVKAKAIAIAYGVELDDLLTVECLENEK